MADPRPSAPPRAVPARLLVIAALVIFNVVLSPAFQDALFLSYHGRQSIPKAMLLGSLVTALCTLLASRLLRRVSQATSVRLILWALALLSTLLFLWLWRTPPGPTSTFLLFLFVELSTTLGVAATWGYFQAPLDATGLRLLMPRIGAWAGLGGLCAGLLIPLVLPLGGPRALVLISGLGWGAAALLIRDQTERRLTTARWGLRAVAALPLCRWMIVGTAGVVWMGLLVQYQTRVALQRHLSPEEIARTMGALLATTAVFGVAVQALLTTPILERWGVGLALSVLPSLVGVLIGVYLGHPMLGLIAAAFFIDKTLRPNLHRPAESCLLAAVAPAARPTLLLLLGSVAAPLLKALGALGLWAATGHGSAVPERAILAIALVIGVALVALSRKWGSLYARTLRETLEDGAVDLFGEDEQDEELVPRIDGPRLQILLEALTRGSPRSRELALEMLRPHRSDLVKRAMGELIEHSDAEVRVLALRWLGDEPSVEMLPHLSRRFADPATPPKERAALLAAAGPLAAELLGQDLSPWLSSPDLALRAAVVGALLSHPLHKAAAQQALRVLVHGAREEERLCGVRLAREQGQTQVLPLLLELLSRDTLRVRREVLTTLPLLGAAGVMDEATWLGPLWAALSDKELAHTASRALSSCAVEILPRIRDALGQSRRAETEALRVHLLRTLGLSGSLLAAPLLLDALASPAAEHNEGLRGLGQLRRRGVWEPSQSERARIEEALLADLRQGLHLRRCRELLSRRRQPTSLLLRELRAQLDAVQERAYRALCLLLPPQELSAVVSALRSTAPLRRDQARELLRARLPQGPILLGSLHVLDERSEWDEECFRPPFSLLAETDPALRGGPEAALRWLQAAGDAWIRSALRHDPGCEVALPQTGEDPMKASLDILLFLKDVALFETLTNQQLVEVAQLAEKVEVAAGTVLFDQGDPADYLYLVRRGKCIVRAFGQEVARLGHGECVGEMAVLADIERTATVVAAEACQLLRFDAGVFKDLLDSYPEIGRGLMRSLVRRLMAMGGPRSASARPATITGMVWSDPSGPVPLPTK